MGVQSFEHQQLHDYFKMDLLPVGHRQENEPEPEPELDIIKFSAGSSHRLPTVSATQALQNAVGRSRRLSTSLSELDSILGTSQLAASSSGIPRGQVTEVYGPPGVGKTAFALQVAVNAARSSGANQVCWVSAGPPIFARRVEDFISGQRVPARQYPAAPPPASQSELEVLENISFFYTHTLPDLLIQFLHPTTDFPPPQASLVVIDDLSTLLLGAFPRYTPRSAAAGQNAVRERQLQKAASRRWAILADLAAAFSRMAASRNIAVLVINQTGTTILPGHGAILRPALSGRAWELAVQNRILLYRDFVPANVAQRLPKAVVRRIRFAKVVKLNGNDTEGESRLASFVIRRGGLQQVRFNRRQPAGSEPFAQDDTNVPDAPSAAATPAPAPAPAELNIPKQPPVIEIADSEDEAEDESHNFHPSSPPDQDADMLLSADVDASYIRDVPPYVNEPTTHPLLASVRDSPPLPMFMMTASQLHRGSLKEEAELQRQLHHQQQVQPGQQEDDEEEERLTSSGDSREMD